MVSFIPPLPSSSTVIGGDTGIVVSGNTTYIKSSTTVLSTPIIYLNYENPIAPLAGLEVKRNGSASFQLFWNENFGYLMAGINGSLERIPTISGSGTGLVTWNGSRLVIGNEDLTVNDLVVNGTLTINSQELTFPSNTGLNGQVLTTNGSGVLHWSSVSGGGGGNSAYITNTSGNSSVEVLDTESISLVTSNTTRVEVTDDKTRITNNLEASAGFYLSVSDIDVQNFTITSSQTVINWIHNIADGSCTLPSASANSGKIIIIHNRNGKDLTLCPAGAETIDGELCEILSNKFDHIKLVSDGIDNWIVI